MSRTFKDKSGYKTRNRHRHSSANSYKISDRTITTRRRAIAADYDVDLYRRGERLKAIQRFEYDRSADDMEEQSLEEEWYENILRGRR